jgi:hypothetical protein
VVHAVVAATQEAGVGGSVSWAWEFKTDLANMWDLSQTKIKNKIFKAIFL